MNHERSHRWGKVPIGMQASRLAIFDAPYRIFEVDRELIIAIKAAPYAPGRIIVSLIALSVFLYSEWNILARWRAEA